MSEKKVVFSFSGVQIMSKNLYPLDEGQPIPHFVYEVKLDTRVQEENEFVVINVTVAIKGADEAAKVFASYSVGCLFKIINFKEFITKNEDGLYLIPDILNKTIQPVSISTVRGIIYSDLKSTYLQNSIMPVIYMTEFKPEKELT